jgi:hypothetical protein
MRKPLLIALGLLVGTAACTSLLGDFTVKESSGDGGPDSSGGVEAGDDSEAGGTVTAVASDVSVYLGQTAKLDGSQSTTTEGTLAYVWTVLNAPTGSNITSASLTGAGSATPSFTPDVLGTYTLKLVVSAFGAQDQIPVHVNAVLPQVIYAQGTVKDAGATESYNVADFDGGNARPLMCPKSFATTIPNEIATYAAYAGRAYDFWEAPAGTPSKFAGFLVDYTTGVGFSAHLYAGTTASACDGGAEAGVVDLFATNFGPGAPYGSSPHFSPDGTRFVVYDRNWQITTYSADGSPPTNVVTKYPLPFNTPGLDPSGAQALNSYTLEPPRVEWVSGATGAPMKLAWAAPQPLPDGGLGWAIFEAQDGVGTQVTTYMTCAGVVPRQFAILSNGNVIASYRQTPSSPENLVHIKVTSGQCNVDLPYTTLGNVSGAIATDFDLSPDGTKIAYLAVDPTGSPTAAPWMVTVGDAGAQLPGGYVYVVGVSGGNPKQVSSKPALFGPRWIGAGASLVFTSLDGVTSTGNLQTSVVIVQPDGTGQNAVVKGDGVNTFVSTSGSGACSTAPGERGAPIAGALLSLAAVAELVRRRVRRR